LRHDVDWSKVIANIAVGTTIAASGVSRAKLGFVEEFGQDALRVAIHDRMAAYYYPYGRSINACLASSISPVLCEANWPDDSMQSM
jgi:hypothetical protein